MQGIECMAGPDINDTSQFVTITINILMYYVGAYQNWLEALQIVQWKEGNDKRLRHQRWPQQENHLLVLIRACAYLPLVMANDGRSHNSSPTNQWDEIGINNRKKTASSDRYFIFIRTTIIRRLGLGLV